MQRLWRAMAVLTAVGLLPAGRAVAQTGFNGVITFKTMSSSGRADTVTQMTKGRRVRLDGFGGRDGSMIIDNEAKRIMIIQPERKQYMTMTEEDAKQMQAMMGPMMERMKHQRPGASERKFNFTKTGKTETVAGVPCEVYHGEVVGADKEKDEGEACVATGVGFALADLTFNNPMLMGRDSDRFEQYRQLVGANKGILKASRLENGKPQNDLEAIKIEKTTVPDSMFQPPAGYTEVRMADMMMKAHGGMTKDQGKAP
jgi:hypothetical protein